VAAVTLDNVQFALVLADGYADGAVDVITVHPAINGHAGNSGSTGIIRQGFNYSCGCSQLFFAAATKDISQKYSYQD
jgi:hypothetical protein